MKESFYTWPGNSFPFRLYLDRPECRIFIIENIFHNYNWLKEVKGHIRETDFFFVLSGWNMSQHIAQTNKKVLNELGISQKQFFILYNDLDEMGYGSDAGFNGDLIPQASWMDESRFKIIQSEKKYNALYIARPTEFKRHYLASGIKKLALAAGGANHNNPKVQLPKSLNDPFKNLNRKEIVDIINESRCGLCLSEEEGASFCSAEYLLCGVPVVSTPSKGGRQLWYNLNNSIITEPNQKDVAKAVEQIIEKKLDPELIREEHIKKMGVFRGKFISVLNSLFKTFGISDINAAQFFHENFFEKMRGGMYQEDVIKIFQKNT